LPDSFSVVFLFAPFKANAQNRGNLPVQKLPHRDRKVVQLRQENTKRKQLLTGLLHVIYHD
jgi:hypothetical protein